MVTSATETRRGTSDAHPTAKFRDILTEIYCRAPQGLFENWIFPLAITLFAGILRFQNLGNPHSLVFDETYYVKDAYSYLESGYERKWEEETNPKFAQGDFSGLQEDASYVVHPPVGKWMIALGMLIFGPESSTGWRWTAALVGTLSVFLVARLGNRLFKSAVLGCTAAILLSVDGLHITMSRIGILDIFLMFWVLLAFYALILDREDGRKQLSRRLSGRTGPILFNGMGPWLGMRWWRLAMGVSLGLAIGTKWSALYITAAFGLLAVWWDATARKEAGISRWLSGAVLKDGIFAFLVVVGSALVVYIGSWTGWLVSQHAYFRQWAVENPGEGPWWLPGPLRALWHYHVTAYDFHVSLDSAHSYSSQAWQWLYLARPTSFYYESSQPGEDGCTAETKCSTAINALGNPLFWWIGIIALAVLVAVVIRRRDWRISAVLVAFAASWVPWLMYPNRTTFFFYAVVFTPYLALALAYMLRAYVRNSPGFNWVWPTSRKVRFRVAGGIVVATVLLGFFFYPIWAAYTVPYETWLLRMWFPSREMVEYALGPLYETLHFKAWFPSWV